MNLQETNEIFRMELEKLKDKNAVQLMDTIKILEDRLETTQIQLNAARQMQHELRIKTKGK